MAKGTRLEVDTDEQNNCIWIMEYLSDEWDRESVVGKQVFRYREDALKAGRQWLYSKAQTLEQVDVI